MQLRFSILLKKQAVSTALGLAAMFFFARVDYHKWEKFATLAYIGSIVLVLLLLTPLGITANGATRWLNLGMSLQPAEVAKLGVILFLASLVCKMGKGVRTIKGAAIIIGFAGVLFVLIYKISSNLSSAIIVLGIAVVMLFVASPDYKKFVIAGLIVVALAAAIVLYIVNQGYRRVPRAEDFSLAASGAVLYRYCVSDAAGALRDRFGRYFWKRLRAKHAEARLYSGSTERYDLQRDL